MQKGRVSEITYKRSVLKRITSKTEGTRPGIDAAAMKLEDIMLIMSSNCILNWFRGCEEFYIQKTINGIYAKGGQPKYIQLEINIPEDFEEKKFDRCVQEGFLDESYGINVARAIYFHVVRNF